MRSPGAIRNLLRSSGDSALTFAAALVAGVIALAAGGCSDVRDLGWSTPHGKLPVDERNPVVLLNDGAYDNWQGEYAVLLANAGGPRLVGIIVSTQPGWPDIAANLKGWQGLVTAARASGIPDLPDPITSMTSPLSAPANGDIDSTSVAHSDGAQLIVDESARLALPYRPLVVVTGGRLTDVAVAYLLDPDVVNRVVVVASLGRVTSSGATMGDPNGNLDPWACTIVASRFKYVQVSAFYDQLTDVPASRLAHLPKNPLGDWIAAKQPNIQNLLTAADQVGIEALAIHSFVSEVDQVAPDPTAPTGGAGGPGLTAAPNGNVSLVSKIVGSEATNRLWQLLGP